MFIIHPTIDEKRRLAEKAMQRLNDFGALPREERLNILREMGMIGKNNKFTKPFGGPDEQDLDAMRRGDTRQHAEQAQKR